MARKAKKRRNRTPKVIIKKLPEKIIINKEESEIDYYYNEEYNNTPEDKRFDTTYTYGDAGVIKDYCNNRLGVFKSALLTEYDNILDVKVIREERRIFEGLTLKEQREYRNSKVPIYNEEIDLNKKIHYNSKILDIIGDKNEI